MKWVICPCLLGSSQLRLGCPSPASLEQTESAWSHFVSGDRSQAWHPAGSWPEVRFPGVNQQLFCTRRSGCGFPIPVSTLAPCGTATRAVTFLSPSQALADSLPPAWAHVFRIEGVHIRFKWIVFSSGHITRFI